MRFNVLWALVVGSSILGCSGKAEEALARMTKERDEAQAKVAALTAESSAAATKATAASATIATLEAENLRLKQTAQFYFDQAGEAEKSAAAADSDDSDRAAIAAFKEVQNRFPSDPLAAAAKDKIAGLEKQISGRAAKLKRDQAAVLRLIQTCQREAATAERIHKDSLVFNQNNDLNMNAAMAGARQAEGHEKASAAAKEKAEELVKTVPDPDGSLAKKAEDCDRVE